MEGGECREDVKGAATSSVSDTGGSSSRHTRTADTLVRKAAQSGAIALLLLLLLRPMTANTSTTEGPPSAATTCELNALILQRKGTGDSVRGRRCRGSNDWKCIAFLE